MENKFTLRGPAGGLESISKMVYKVRQILIFNRRTDMGKKTLSLSAFLLLLSALAYPVIACRTWNWTTLVPGVEYGIFPGNIHIVRANPSEIKLKLLLASEHDKKLRTTAGWCKEFNLIAAINAGMYATDYSTNVGYLRNGEHVQNGRWSRNYKSALAFDPILPGLAPAVMVDLDEPDARTKLKDYRSVVQNLRLLKGNGVNVWQKSDRRWSEAAVGMNDQGRIFFIFCPVPYLMSEFNDRITKLGLGITRMMHMEGGKEASLSVRSDLISRNLAGGFDQALQSDNSTHEQWPIPNVLGIQAK
jgi:hypothetical protein